ncbi:SPOSA6832_00567 [Sporobolomyces salmonicolor]|uniref:peptidylprolyl isomerase n=1 Tax=Sporidiobolus salmonicolor TaxID=5005 RepID=A0A0D6EGD1_SPOSA|nr:SPOSA6832_00567 [Sporobolomyces salmonicolor]
MSTPTRCFITIAAGDETAYKVEVEKYEDLMDWLAQHGAKYGLAGQLEELDESARETLSAIYEGDTKVALAPDSFSPPPSLCLPRLQLLVSGSSGLRKTTANFLDLLTDSKSLTSKRSPHSPLRYVGTPVFRIERDFVAQMGDVTRGDGSGGESICKFFVTLTSDPAKLKRLTGKYVAFGQAVLEDPETRACLERLNDLADGKGGTRLPVWIAECNVLSP